MGHMQWFDWQWHFKNRRRSRKPVKKIDLLVHEDHCGTIHNIANAVGLLYRNWRCIVSPVWSEQKGHCAEIFQGLSRSLSVCHWWAILHVEDHHQQWELSLLTQSRDDLAVVKTETPFISMTDESTTGLQLNQEKCSSVFSTQYIAHQEFIPQGQAMNGKLYWNSLKCWREDIWWKWPGLWRVKNWNHDDSKKTPCHWAFLTSKFLPQTNLVSLLHLLYSPDLVL